MLSYEVYTTPGTLTLGAFTDQAEPLISKVLLFFIPYQILSPTKKSCLKNELLWGFR